MRKLLKSRLFFALVVGVILCISLILITTDSIQYYFNKFLQQADIGKFPFEGIMSNALALLSLQIFCVIALARALGSILAKFRQRAVVGEVLAGILLGPSFLGALFPELFNTLFPAWSLINLQIVSQFGLIFFMFIVGTELDVKVLKNIGRTARGISHGSILLSFALGILLSYLLFPHVSIPGVSFISFTVFVCITLSITSYALLIRTVQKRTLSKTPFGNIALTAAAVDSITAWFILALTIIFVKAGNFWNGIFPMLFGIAYVVIMFYVVQPMLNRLGSVYASRELFNKKIVGLVFLVLLGSTYVAEIIGIHPLFGAFLAGLVMPQNLFFKKILVERIEDISVVLFLPVFFVFVGLRTDISILGNTTFLLLCLLVILFAITAKFAGSFLVARLYKQSWKNSLRIGVMMNTRGLITLIVITIGSDLKIISDELFTMMVLMALASTILTRPLLDSIDKAFSKKEILEKAPSDAGAFRILVSFGLPKMGSTLLRLADQLILKQNRNVEITGLHITPSAEVKPYEAVLYEKEGFQPIKSTAQLLGLKLNTLYRNSADVDKEIVFTVKQGNYNMVLVGAARPVFSDRITGGKLKQLLEDGKANVGVLIDRGFVLAEGILVLLGSDDDMALLQYAHRFQLSSQARITVLKMGDGHTVDVHDGKSPYHSIANNFKEVIEHRIPDKQLLIHFNLVMVGLEHWKELNERSVSWIKDCPSILVIKHFKDLAPHTPHTPEQR